MNKQVPKKGSKLSRNMQVYAKYSSLAFQMMGIVLAGVFGGMWLDKKINWNFPIMTLILSMLSVTLAIYYAIKDFLKKPKS